MRSQLEKLCSAETEQRLNEKEVAPEIETEIRKQINQPESDADGEEIKTMRRLINAIKNIETEVKETEEEGNRRGRKQK